MQDANGNYVTGLTDNGVYTPSTATTISYPQPKLGMQDANGNYITGLTDNGINFSGGAGSGGGGGSGNVISSSIDPTGVVIVTGPAICFGTNAVDGLVWKKTSSGTDANWIQM